MKRNVRHAITALFVVLVAALFSIRPLAAGTQNQKNFLWRVQSRTGTVYILGSIHFLKKEMYPLNPTIENAFEQSDTLAVEANIQNINPSELQKRLKDGFYKAGDSLEQHVSRETYDLVRDASAKLGLRFDVVKQQKPWLLGLTLPSLMLKKFGYDQRFGVDNYFLSQAKGNKKILELEGVDFQIDLLSGFNETEQELMLMYTLKEMAGLGQKIDSLVAAWKTGNAKEVESLESQSMKEDSRLNPIYEKILFARNRTITARIEDIMKTSSTCFVVVGAAHLVGEKGIIRLLADKGYAIEQM